MTTRPRSGGPASPAQDIANLGLVRPPLVYLISLVSGVVIQLATPLPLLPETLARPVGPPLVVVAIALLSYSVATFWAAGTPVPARKPTTAIVHARALIASAETRSIWRFRCCSSVSRSGSTACGCWPRSSGRWHSSTVSSYREKSSTLNGNSVCSTWTIRLPCAGGSRPPNQRLERIGA